MGAANDPYRLRYICIDPLTGPEGVKYTAYNQSATNGQWHVTTYAENPELCFRVGDMQFTEEFFLLGRFGVENEKLADRRGIPRCQSRRRADRPLRLHGL